VSTILERFKQWFHVDSTSERLAWRIAEQQFWPPRPTEAQLAGAGVRIVGEEPCLVMPDESVPLAWGSGWGSPDATPFRNHRFAPLFVWRVERVK
jgi:hypothetical protein